MKMPGWGWIAFVVGLGALIALTAWQGFGAVSRGLSNVGWRVFWLVPLFSFPLMMATWAWGVLFAPEERPAWTRLAFARWIGLSVNQLLPVARVGGEVARARLVSEPERRSAAVVTSILADKTAQVASVGLFALMGLFALSWRASKTEFVVVSLVGIVAVAGFGIAFFVAQVRGGVHAAGRWISVLLPESTRESWLDTVGDTQDRLSRVYATRAFATSVVANVLFRVGIAVEVWLSLWFLGVRVDVLDAVIIEGLNQMLRAAVFIVPGALGAQEGGFIALGAVVGVPAPAAIAVSLCMRARELLVGIPALLAWQIREGMQGATGTATPRPDEFR